MPQKPLYICSIGESRYYFQLQSQNMTVRPLSLIPLINAPSGKIQHVLYYRNYSADVFVVHNIFLECCIHALHLQYGLSWEARSSFSSYMYVPGKYYTISERLWHQCTSCCDIGDHAEYNRTGIPDSSLFLKLDNIHFA